MNKQTRDRSKDLNRLGDLRSLERQSDNDKMILEGKAVTFNEPTVLFEYNGEKVVEIIDRNAFMNTDFSKAFLKYNHSNEVMALARYKPNDPNRKGSLELEVRDDGLYMRAELLDIQSGRDLYTAVKNKVINKMSFAFTRAEKNGVYAEDYSFDSETKTHLYIVREIDTLYDVAAVNVPAYENTNIYARRKEMVESRKAEVEFLVKKRKAEKNAMELAKARMKMQIELSKINRSLKL